METANKGMFKLSEYVMHCFICTVYSLPQEVLCNLECRRRVVYMVQFCMQMGNPFFRTFIYQSFCYGFLNLWPSFEGAPVGIERKSL